METERQREWEHRHSTRTGRQQEYIREMLDSVEENLKNTGEEQRQNEEFENRMRAKVYQMYGITEDKLQGWRSGAEHGIRGRPLRCFSCRWCSLAFAVFCTAQARKSVFLWHFTRQSRERFSRMAGREHRGFGCCCVSFICFYTR